MDRIWIFTERSEQIAIFMQVKVPKSFSYRFMLFDCKKQFMRELDISFSVRINCALQVKDTVYLGCRSGRLYLLSLKSFTFDESFYVV